MNLMILRDLHVNRKDPQSSCKISHQELAHFLHRNRDACDNDLALLVVELRAATLRCRLPMIVADKLHVEFAAIPTRTVGSKRFMAYKPRLKNRQPDVQVQA